MHGFKVAYVCINNHDVLAYIYIIKLTNNDIILMLLWLCQLYGHLHNNSVSNITTY